MTETEQRELAEILAEMGYDRASRTWKSPPVDHPSLWNVAVGAACAGGACLIAAAIPAPPHLPISLMPFYLGVACAVTLGSLIGHRRIGWYAFLFALLPVCWDARVAEPVWTVLTVATLALIASIGSRRDRRGPSQGHRPRSPAPSRPLSSAHRVALPAAPYGLTRHA